MYTLIVLFPVWLIDYESYRGSGHSFTVKYGPFDSEQQARWLWLMMKDKLQRNYEVAIIVDENDNECYIDESARIV